MVFSGVIYLGEMSARRQGKAELCEIRDSEIENFLQNVAPIFKQFCKV